MYFDLIPCESTPPDPITDPGLIPTRNIRRVPQLIPGTENSPQRIAVVTKDESGQGPNLTAEIWTEVELTPELTWKAGDEQIPLAKRIWRLLGEIVVAGGDVGISSFQVTPGNIYVRVTAGAGADELIGIGYL